MASVPDNPETDRPSTEHSGVERRGVQPFGAPAVQCTVLAAEVPLSAAIPPACMHRRTRCSGRVLFASSERGKRSIVITRSVLRLVVRGATAHVSALHDVAKPLLGVLSDRLPDAVQTAAGLAIPVPVSPGAVGAVDRDALRAPSLFDPVRAVAGLLGDREPEALPPGLFGVFGFDLIDRFESLPARRPDPFDDPDIELVLALDMVCYDHERGVARVVTRGLPWEPMAVVSARHASDLALLRSTVQREPPMRVICSEPESKRPDAEFLDNVATLREHIAAGDIFQAVLSRAVQWRCTADSLDVFEVLAAREPSPYSFHLELEHGALFGSSPETCLSVIEGMVEILPIAGTAARNEDPDTDERLALAMLFDPKERAEHVMLLDLARNDVARVAVPGTTEVVQLLGIEKYSRVQHLVSRVRGQLRPELDALHAYRAAANMGTLTGAPKPRAMELLRELEPAGRGFYGGAVGYLLADGRFDSCITIRSMRKIGDVYGAQSGAGIIWHSDAHRELEETERKLRRLREVMTSCSEVNAYAEVSP